MEHLHKSGSTGGNLRTLNRVSSTSTSSVKCGSTATMVVNINSFYPILGAGLVRSLNQRSEYMKVRATSMSKMVDPVVTIKVYTDDDGNYFAGFNYFSDGESIAMYSSTFTIPKEAVEDLLPHWKERWK